MIGFLTAMYYFGLYHWRERLRSLFVGCCSLLALALIRRLTPSKRLRSLAGIALFPALSRAVTAGSKLLRPPPWSLERYKYDALGTELPFKGKNNLLDIGCGTGRSLVGLAPHLPEGSSVVGLDVFDDRVILGNAPLLARRNASKAGIDVIPVRGDAARIPLKGNSQDLVTACRVLHDLPEENHERTLREIRRVCRPDGVLGILEIPIAPGERDPETYWRERVTESGFAVQKVNRVPRKGDGEPYIVIVAEPSSGRA